MIPLEELTMFGKCVWVEEERALKLWVDGLDVRAEKQLPLTADEARRIDEVAAVKDALAEELVVLALRSYRSNMKNPSSFTLNSVYGGYYSPHENYDFTIIADISGTNSYGGMVRSESIMLVSSKNGSIIFDYIEFLDELIDSGWSSSTIYKKNEALALKTDKANKLKKFDTDRISSRVIYGF